MIYEGDTDACGLQTNPVEDVFVDLFKTLGLNRTRKWRPWTTNGQQKMGGYTIEWNGGDVRFVSIRGSGHLAPLNRPHITQKMMADFIAGESLPRFIPPTAKSTRV